MYFVARLYCTWLFLVLQSEYTKLEAENAHLDKQLGELLEKTSKTSSKINFLEKENIQLKRELGKATVYYETSVG
jgi:peptidoglycan hydrolase CwlO-like protein